MVGGLSDIFILYWEQKKSSLFAERGDAAGAAGERFQIRPLEGTLHGFGGLINEAMNGAESEVAGKTEGTLVNATRGGVHGGTDIEDGDA